MLKSRRSTSDPLDRIRRAVELLAPVMHRPDAVEPFDRAVKILVGEPPRARRQSEKLIDESVER